MNFQKVYRRWCVFSVLTLTLLRGRWLRLSINILKVYHLKNIKNYFYVSCPLCYQESPMLYVLTGENINKLQYTINLNFTKPIRIRPIVYLLIFTYTRSWDRNKYFRPIKVRYKIPTVITVNVLDVLLMINLRVQPSNQIEVS